MLEHLDPNMSAAVAKLGKRGRSESDLGKRRQPLIDEALEPTALALAATCSDD